MTKQVNLDYHENTDEFSAALASGTSITGFSSRLIEKDYYCSLILRDFEPLFRHGIVFKGGTCLSKIHTGFYRLSEDLDFAISINSDATRSNRRNKMNPVKEHLEELSKRLSCFTSKDPFIGYNASREYKAGYSYYSVVSGQEEFIKIEISLREPLIEPIEIRSAQTILINPFRNEPAIVPFTVKALSLRELYAEKFRAAMTRRVPAIRDFYDINYAVNASKLDLTDSILQKLIKQKLDLPGISRIDLSEKKLTTLKTQLETQLKPVLRNKDYQSFDLDRAFDIVKKIMDSL